MYAAVTVKRFAAFLIISSIAYAVPNTAWAAAIEVTSSVRAALDKTIAAADPAKGARINRLYNEFLDLNEQDASNKAQIKSLHDANAERLAVVRKQIKQIDADTISRLEAQVKQARERYKPLLKTSASMNKTVDFARVLHLKPLGPYLSSGADAVRLPAQLAREDIRNKEEQLQAAKDAAAKKIRAVRAVLDDIDPLSVRIKAENSSLSSSGRTQASLWKSFTKAVGKSNPSGAAEALNNLVPLSREIVDRQQKVITLEGRVRDLIAKAQGMITSS